METGYKSLADYAQRHFEKHLSQLKPDQRDRLKEQFPMNPGHSPFRREPTDSRRGFKLNFKLVFAVALFALVIYFWFQPQATPSHTPWGHPPGTVFKRYSYTLGFGLNRKMALWVSFQITGAKGEKSIQGWHEDPEIPINKQLSNKVISNLECERKTLIPPRLIKVTKKSHARETRYFSVTVPMLKRLRQTLVSRVENRALSAAEEESVWLIAGPHLGERGYKPVGFFYIIVRGEPTAPILESYYFVHKDYGQDAELEAARSSLAEIEQRTGLTFFPDLARDVISERP